MVKPYRSALDDFTPRVPERPPSDRNFGLTMAAALCVVWALPRLHHRPWRWWALGLSCVFAVVTLVRPELLRPVNRLWMRLGGLLQRVVQPVIVALLFAVVFAPVGIVLRWLKRDPLALRMQPDLETYWIPRRPEKGGSMENQF